MKGNKGISLIVLIITIIIIIILSGTIILSLVNDNPIGMSKEAKFKKNIEEYNSELTMAISKKYFDNHDFNPDTFDEPIWNGSGDGMGTIKEFITSITKEDAAKFKIENSRLVYVGTDELEVSWLKDFGIDSQSKTLPTGLGLNVIANQNITFDGNPARYNNPIIPKGFKAINDGAIWPADWNLGLVIEDENENQFVWVPVDKVSVPYAKWCTTGISHSTATDDTILSGTVNEQTQIDKYGGFYIARYEAGIIWQGGILVSKRGTEVWTYVDYPTSKSSAESMYNTVEVKSGLITGKQWDTVVEWIKDSEKNITDSREWGNFYDSESPANVAGYGEDQTAGYSESWKAKNIYDLAGNMSEWTNEIYNTYRICRGGNRQNSGSSQPVAYRDYQDTTYNEMDVTFRVVLYVM